ncbi:MAG: hypothetical protein H6Q23_2479, partial [Bacteroidetes bacterium]|nr:hypothetical protein [Bacteroidota bacterium]
RIESGNLIGLMGGSGVGKTTMLNILHGKTKPTTGNIFINGYDLNSDSEKLTGLIGFVPQDDMLIEELTVYENLYFNARLCFGDYNEEQLNQTVDKVLLDLDLFEIRELQVGDVMNKKVSGGQRKRLNIGLELMREPGVLFVDEPTSGLSSFDSEKVMSLLKNQALTGKLVFTIIHQPSSDILKMFDRLWILDKGGYMIYDGDHIVEVKVIDNAGYAGKERQVSPKEWYEKYIKKMMPVFGDLSPKTSLPLSNFRVPKKSSQLKTFIKRNITRKLADRQYMTINLLEVPILAFILAFISKYSEGGVYLFGLNKNYPVFLFMAIIVALFVGLTVSAEEIFRDRKILEREKFLNISRSSYLLSKVSFLFVMSAIQSLSFVLVANTLLEVKGMLFQQWLILFSTACFGNMLGLNISAGMRTAVSIYILIPLLLVPMLLLGGAMIKFDDLHNSISRKIYVPVIGDAMVTRWSYEALMVEEFKNNKFEKPFFELDMEFSQTGWYSSFLLPTLKVKVDYCKAAGKNPDREEISRKNFRKLNYHFKELSDETGLVPGSWIADLNYDGFNDYVAEQAKLFIDSLSLTFRARNKIISDQRDAGMKILTTTWQILYLTGLILTKYTILTKSLSRRLIQSG